MDYAILCTCLVNLGALLVWGARLHERVEAVRERLEAGEQRQLRVEGELRELWATASGRARVESKRGG